MTDKLIADGSFTLECDSMNGVKPGIEEILPFNSPQLLSNSLFLEFFGRVEGGGG